MMINIRLKQLAILSCVVFAPTICANQQPIKRIDHQVGMLGTIPCMTLPPIPDKLSSEQIIRKNNRRFLVNISTTALNPIQTVSCHWDTQIEVPQDKRLKLTHVELQGSYQMPQLGRAMVILRNQNNNINPTEGKHLDDRVAYEVIRMRESGRFEELKTFEYESQCGESLDINWQMHLLVRRPREEVMQGQLFIDMIKLEAGFDNCETETR